MSVVILGGNECMEQKYKSLCRDYRHEAKVMVTAMRPRSW